MTNPLAARLRKLAEFDGFPFGSMSAETASFYRGIKDESARLAPLIAGLIAVFEEAYEIKYTVETAEITNGVATSSFSPSRMIECIDRLEKLCSGDE